MARIRSLHPGQWNDDDFLECSPLARLLALGLRNLADDRGVFEWKPTAIKRSLLPADNCDIETLLAELAVPKIGGAHDGMGRVIQPFKVGARLFGAIRNFGKYQRPQKPSVTFPLPDELKDYSNLAPSLRAIRGIDDPESGAIIGIEAARPAAIPFQYRNSESDEGGRRKEEGGNSVPSERRLSAAPKSPSADDRTWLFNEGLNMLVELAGTLPGRTRSLIGSWLKALGDDEPKLRAVFEECAKVRPAEPVAWLTKAVAAKKPPPPAPATPALDPHANDRQRVDLFKRKGIWVPVGTANPTQLGCDVSGALLAEFGFPAENGLP